MISMSKVLGISLTGLLISLVILAILVGLSLPAFKQSYLKSRRYEARSALLQIQHLQERWHSQHSQYATLQQLGIHNDAEAPYRLNLIQADSRQYLVTAIPQGSQQEDDCGTFAIDASGPVYGAQHNFAAAECWQE